MLTIFDELKNRPMFDNIDNRLSPESRCSNRMGKGRRQTYKHRARDSILDNHVSVG